MGIEAVLGPHGLDTIAALPLYPTTRSGKEESHVVLAGRTATQRRRCQAGSRSALSMHGRQFCAETTLSECLEKHNMSLVDWTQAVPAEHNVLERPRISKTPLDICRYCRSGTRSIKHGNTREHTGPRVMFIWREERTTSRV